jgi:hypothetical protein
VPDHISTTCCLKKGNTMRRTSRSSQRIIGLSLLGGIALLAVVAIVLFSRTSNTAAVANPTPVTHFVTVSTDQPVAPEAIRTLVVAPAGQTLPQLSGVGGVLMANLVRGQLTAEATQATVQTDENCAPDQQGISHCLNQLTIGTRAITIQHHHTMSTTPCLTPGETVQLLTLAQYQRKNG